MAQPGSGEILFQGIAKHGASFGSYFKWTLISLVGGGIAIAINQLWDAAPGWLAVLWLVGVPGLAWTWLSHITTKYKVSRRRIETEKGVLAKKVDTLELWRVLDVQYEQSLLDRILGLGRIKLLGTDQTDPVLELHGIPNHRQLFEVLRDAVQDARQTNRPMELVPGQEHLGHGHHAFEQGGTHEISH